MTEPTNLIRLTDPAAVTIRVVSLLDMMVMLRS